MFPCDLHTHTFRSDGHESPLESIDRAAGLGLKVLAITDHDMILPALYEGERGSVNLEKYARERGIELLRGIEISCDRDNEDCHIVGLFCRWEDGKFADLEKWVQHCRAESYQKILENLSRKGFPVSWQEFLEDAHRQDCPENVYKKQIFEYLAHKGIVDTWQEGKRLIQKTPGINAGRDKPDPADIIRLLHETGGKAILAHPYLIKEKPLYQNRVMDRNEYIDILVEAGLDGIEACYSYHKTSYSGGLGNEEIGEKIRTRYKGKVFFSGGSDFHGDYKTGMKNPRELGECGVMLEYYRQYIKPL